MNKENVVLTLWGECKKIFLSASNEQLEDLLKNILEIVRKNYIIFQQIADLKFLDYVVIMDANEYIIGTTGDNFELILKAYIQQKDISLEIIWRILAQLIWDLTLPVTDKICPFCHCDNLALLTDEEKKHIYMNPVKIVFIFTYGG